MDAVCTITTDWSSTILTAGVAGMCGVWAWKSLSLQIAHSVERKRMQDEQYDRQRTLRHLTSMRERAIAKWRETLRGYDKKRHMDEAACYLEAIQRLEGAYIEDQDVNQQEAA